MNVNYQVAAHRHFRDGEFLQESRRMPSADHLYGLSAECSLKAIMVGLGAQTLRNGDLADREHRLHINVLWDYFQTFAHGRQAARYLSKLPPENPFVDWEVDQRYADDNHVQARDVHDHHDGARSALVALERAMTDGKVP